MVTHKVKVIVPEHEEIKHTHRDNWEVMKPFVKFSFKALSVIGMALLAIVKALPLLKPHKDTSTAVKRR
jgi:hypothetical protein